MVNNILYLWQLEIDYHIFNAGEFYAPQNSNIPDIPQSRTCTAVNLTEKRITILGIDFMYLWIGS